MSAGPVKRTARRLMGGVALVLATLGAARLMTDGELQKVIWSAAFPSVCGDVRLAVNGMRSKPTTNPAALHQFIGVVTKCGTGSFASHYEGLYNLSVYTASAAALLAARHEGAKAAAGDAQFAVDAANIIIGAGRGRGGDIQSPYASTAQRIKSDAQSLLTSLGSTATPAPATAAPAPVAT